MFTARIIRNWHHPSVSSIKIYFCGIIIWKYNKLVKQKTKGHLPPYYSSNKAGMPFAAAQICQLYAERLSYIVAQRCQHCYTAADIDIGN